MSDSVRPHRRQPTRLPGPWDSPGKNTGVGYHFLLQCMKVKSESEVAQSCPTLRDPMDCSLPGSSIHGIFHGCKSTGVGCHRLRSGKESVCQRRRCRRLDFNPGVRKLPWRRAWQPTPVSLPGESHGQRSLEGYSPRCHKEWDMTERLTLSPTHTNLACSLSSGFSRCSVDILSMNSHFSDILSIK